MAPPKPDKKETDQSSLLTKIWAEIEGYDTAARSFNTEGDRIYSLYINNYNLESGIIGFNSKFDIIWSNTQLLQPIIFSQMPQPYVERRFKDKDPQGRRASLILERCIKAVLSLQDTIGTIKQARDDYLLVARGQVWCRYSTVMDNVEQIDEQGNPVLDPKTNEPVLKEVLKYENVEIEYVPWKDFGYSSAKVWGGVKSVWRHLYLTKDDAIKQLGKAEASLLKYTYSESSDPKRSKEESSGLHKRAKVTEFWDYDSKMIYWISESNKNTIIKEKKDPLTLNKFFPCPKPLFGTKKTDNLIPVSDYTILRSLVSELDIVTLREACMMDAMKASGVSSGQVAQALKAVFESDDAVIQPIKEWLTLKAQGGTQGGAIEWLPLDMFAKVLEQLRARKEELKNDIYELAGISDVVRGTTNPYESGKALEQKSQWASQRINEKQRLVQEFIRDTVNIIAEIISEHFDDSTIFEMAGVEMLGEEYVANFANDVALLRDDITRHFRIDITLDSLVQADEEKEKASVNEFINAMAQIMGQSQAIIAIMPELKPVMMEALKLAAGKYKAGRTLEGMLDTQIDAALQAEEEAKLQPPQEDPMLVIERQKLEIEQYKVQSKTELDGMKTQHKAQLDDAKMQHQIQLDTAKLQIEQAKLETDRIKLQVGQQEASAKNQLDRETLAAKTKEAMMKLELEQASLKLEEAQLMIEKLKTSGQLQLGAADIKAKNTATKTAAAVDLRTSHLDAHVQKHSTMTASEDANKDRKAATAQAKEAAKAPQPK